MKNLIGHSVVVFTPEEGGLFNLFMKKTIIDQINTYTNEMNKDGILAIVHQLTLLHNDENSALIVFHLYK